MKNEPLNYEKIYNTAKIAKEYGVILQTTDDVPYKGDEVIIKGRHYKYFGNCDYLGLGEDQRLRQAAIRAIEQFGIHYVCSRSYVSTHLNEQLEEKLSQLFDGKKAILMRSTHSGTISTFPLIIGPNDAVILDHQVHNCVQAAANMLQLHGNQVFKIPHNNLDALYDKYQELKEKHDKIWYMADGVYSMRGNYGRFKELNTMLDDLEQLHLFVDDSWGISWCGENGKGMVLSQMPFHRKLVLASSLEKGFASGGGAVFLFNDEIQGEIVKNMGSTNIFSGQISNPSLAAAMVATDIHQSGEVHQLQDKLMAKIKLFHDTAKSLNIPLASEQHSPIVFIGIGHTETTAALSQILMRAGFVANISVYPLVPVRFSGLRFVISNYLSDEDIKRVLYVIAESLPQVFKKFDISLESILKNNNTLSM